MILDEFINGFDFIGIVEVRIFICDFCIEWGKIILIFSYIFFEIVLLVDDIGIIDYGILLEEESFV